MVEAEKKLKEMGLELPDVPMVMKNWVRCKRAGNFAFIGNTGPWPLINRGEAEKMNGQIGKDITIEEGREMCLMAALSVLSALKNELGDLDKVDKIVKLDVYINGIGGSVPYSKVADAASELFIALYGENGKATRSIVPINGVADTAAEVELVAYVKD
jgi:enamine deaminase RidA (YjgF/YER057c/UK114 family)